MLDCVGPVRGMEVFKPSHGAPRGDQQRAMLLSVAVGLLMLLGKTGAYLWTNSAAILSDAVESVIHVPAVGFAAYSLWLSSRPANRRFLYGYDRSSPPALRAA